MNLQAGPGKPMQRPCRGIASHKSDTPLELCHEGLCSLNRKRRSEATLYIVSFTVQVEALMACPCGHAVYRNVLLCLLLSQICASHLAFALVEEVLCNRVVCEAHRNRHLFD